MDALAPIARTRRPAPHGRSGEAVGARLRLVQGHKHARIEASRLNRRSLARPERRRARSRAILGRRVRRVRVALARRCAAGRKHAAHERGRTTHTRGPSTARAREPSRAAGNARTLARWRAPRRPTLRAGLACRAAQLRRLGAALASSRPAKGSKTGGWATGWQRSARPLRASRGGRGGELHRRQATGGRRRPVQAPGAARARDRAPPCDALCFGSGQATEGERLPFVEGRRGAGPGLVNGRRRRLALERRARGDVNAPFRLVR